MNQHFDSIGKQFGDTGNYGLRFIKEMIERLSKTRVTKQNFLTLKSKYSKNFVCELLLKDIKFKVGSGLFWGLCNKPSPDIIDTIKDEVTETQEDFDKFCLNLKELKKGFLADRKNLVSPMDNLTNIMVQYCSSVGPDHFEILSILAVNILMSRNREEFEASVVQMKCFIGEKCDKKKLDLFKQLLTKAESILELSLIARSNL